ncbi:hypothetical protein BDQ17DRAFT_1330296 [Cyathus striatus]|nr:hypothetical protein BDQ17DRAFT_1330296 [Cyathus striatus]
MHSDFAEVDMGCWRCWKVDGVQEGERKVDKDKTTMWCSGELHGHKFSKDPFCHQFYTLYNKKHPWIQGVEQGSSQNLKVIPFLGDAFGSVDEYNHNNDMFGQDELAEYEDEGEVDEDDVDEIQELADVTVMEFDWEPVRDDEPEVQADHEDHNVASSLNPWAPFNSRINWEVAKWTKCQGPSSTAFSELLSIDGLHEVLNLSYKNTPELNKIIDLKLPAGHPKFQCHEVVVTGKEMVVVNTVEEQSKQKDCTIIPVLISSDKTQLTTFQNKTAYPVYMTIGNLPKHLVSGNGAVWQCYPIFAAYIGDYPKQVMVTIIKMGQCPSCPAPHEGIGDSIMHLPPHNDGPIHAVLDTVSQDSTAFKQACAAAEIKPVQSPFWKNLPLVNIYQSITPDVLHQLFQGVIKHIISWVRSAVGDAEVDVQCRRFLPNHHIHLFMKGICNLS